jgi:hypothetical protein
MAMQKIRDKIRIGEYSFSEHAVKRMIQRSVNRIDVEHAIINGEIIENYPEDKYSPSCLIYGQTRPGRNLHVHVSLPPAVVIITVYEPDIKEWIDYRIRR